jgi:hypothetical protein
MAMVIIKLWVCFVFSCAKDFAKVGPHYHGNNASCLKGLCQIGKVLHICTKISIHLHNIALGDEFGDELVCLPNFLHRCILKAYMDFELEDVK